METGWNSFRDWQLISRGGCRSDLAEQERDLQPEAFHRQEKTTKKKRLTKTLPVSAGGAIILLIITFRRLLLFVASVR